MDARQNVVQKEVMTDSYLDHNMQSFRCCFGSDVDSFGRDVDRLSWIGEPELESLTTRSTSREKKYSSELAKSMKRN